MAWKKSPKKFSKIISADTNSEAKKIAGKLIRNLIISSPVDTGRFRNNWLVGLGNPVRMILPAGDKSGSKAIRKGLSKIKQQKPFDSIFISNNLPYAKKLNEGHSQQAPANFVESSISRSVK